MTKPFEAQSTDINRLDDLQLTRLLKNLLHAEASRFDLPQRSVEVALNIDTSDGGEDGRVSWKGGPDSTDYLPNRLTLFQNKATTMGPADYRKEVLTKSGNLKPLIKQVLEEQGSYIVFTTQELNTKQKQVRIKEIREELTKQGKSYALSCSLDIYDASRISGWVNRYISAIVLVLHWTGRSFERGLKTFDLWSEYNDFSRLPFTSVKSRKPLLEQLKVDLTREKSCFRIMGLSGLGKTRMAFQVFFEKEELRSLVVYIDANQTQGVDALVSDWVSLELKAILVVDNCDYQLHNRLVKEICREKSHLSLLSLDYNFEKVSSPTVSFTLKPMEDQELTQLLSSVYQKQLPDLDRIARFTQGFPKMAVLLVEARLNEDLRIGELTDDELLNKLLWKRDEGEESNSLKFLQACSLFDFFGVEKEVEEHLAYLADRIGLDLDTVYEYVQRYTERGLIDRRGRFGQVVPKPLAIRLAGQWWEKTREQKREDFLMEIPWGMFEPFCRQIEKMDFHPNIKSLVEKLYAPESPFTQAKNMLSDQGTRILQAFVNVHPNAICTALYRMMNQLDPQQLLSITDISHLFPRDKYLLRSNPIQRSLVETLKKLCFHADLFEESAWCMLLIASVENENCENHATRAFIPFFRVYLSGTAAEPKIRFALLQRALDLKQNEVDMILLQALEKAIGPFRGHRNIGPELQGIKAPLQEWVPKIWKDVFDFWQTAFDLLLILIERGEKQKERVVSIIGKSIRWLVYQGRIEMLDAVIQRVVRVNGKDWLEAKKSIIDSLNYDNKELTEASFDMLKSWLKLLIPDDSDFIGKLKAFVINPPWEHHQGDKEELINVAAESVKKLACDVASNIDLLFPHLELLMKGKPRKSYEFGRLLAIELSDATDLRDRILQQLVAIHPVNKDFACGVYQGIFEKSEDVWQKSMDQLLENPLLFQFYPDFLCTGEIKKQHLDQLLVLRRDDLISSEMMSKANLMNIINNSLAIVVEFCLALSKLGKQEAWIALRLIITYECNKEINFEEIRDPFKELILAVPLQEEEIPEDIDSYSWCKNSQKILQTPDPEFAIALSHQMIAGCYHGLNDRSLREDFRPFLIDLMREYGRILWPLWGDAIVQAEEKERSRLQNFLQREDHSFTPQQPSVLSILPSDLILSWCSKNPKVGPSFLAKSLIVLEKIGEELKPNKLLIQVLENFGNDEQVLSEISGNMAKRGMLGPLVPQLEVERKAFQSLLEHNHVNVRGWAKQQISFIDQKIKAETASDEERNLGVDRYF